MNSLQSSQQSLSRMLLVAGVIIVGIIAMLVAVVLPRYNQSNDNRSQAALSSLLCAGAKTVPFSVCNQGCSIDQDCASGLFCYKTGTATTGLCRLSGDPMSTTCSGATATPTATGTTKPTPTPTAVACTQACTYDSDCRTGQVCVGTNINNSTTTIVETSKNSATDQQLAVVLAPNQPIGMGPIGTVDTVADQSTGKIKYTVVARPSTTYYVHVYRITAPIGQLDPQEKIYEKTFSIGPKQGVEGIITLPKCGRYQIDFGSPSVTGTPYDGNSIGHYFWGGIYEIPCQNGCCQAVNTQSTYNFLPPTTRQSGFTAYRAGVLDSTGKVIGTLGSTVTVSKSANPQVTLTADIYPVLPAGKGSVKFTVDSTALPVDSSVPYQASLSVSALSVGQHTVLVTPYAEANGTGASGKVATFTLVVQ